MEVLRSFVGINVKEKRSFLEQFIDEILIEPEQIKIGYYPPDPKQSLRLISTNEKGGTDYGSPYGNSWRAREDSNLRPTDS